eukprot:9979949-Lingulodinium_polyedra.AAC.1
MLPHNSIAVRAIDIAPSSQLHCRACCWHCAILTHWCEPTLLQASGACGVQAGGQVATVRVP